MGLEHSPLLYVLFLGLIILDVLWIRLFSPGPFDFQVSHRTAFALQDRRHEGSGTEIITLTETLTLTLLLGNSLDILLLLAVFMSAPRPRRRSALKDVKEVFAEIHQAD
jgi:hypothetical protein